MGGADPTSATDVVSRAGVGGGMTGIAGRDRPGHRRPSRLGALFQAPGPHFSHLPADRGRRQHDRLVGMALLLWKRGQPDRRGGRAGQGLIVPQQVVHLGLPSERRLGSTWL
jgi:hypothetical protein